MIKKILVSRCGYKEEEVPLILASAREAIRSCLDIQGFTREVNQRRGYQERLRILENLFRVAFSDQSLVYQELETIRKIATLFWISHKDFINTKLKIKKEMTNR